MFLRSTRASSIVVAQATLLLAFVGCSRLPPADTAAEARRLYDRATAMVSNVTEHDYSYSYMQFHWKRAQSFVDWVKKEYPDTPTGKALVRGELKIGPFEATYFQNRVLPKLEQKRIFATDAVYCSVFLYERPSGGGSTESHLNALSRIIEILCAQNRWREAIDFKTTSPLERATLVTTVVRVAARRGNDAIVTEMIEAAELADRPGLNAEFAGGMARRGSPRTEIATFLEDHPGESTRLAVLAGMIDREAAIRRAAALKLSPDSVRIGGDKLQNPEVRDDVDSAAAELFPGGIAPATTLLARYHAALGERPSARADVQTIAAYFKYLAAFDRADEVTELQWAANLSDSDRKRLDLAIIEALAQAGKLSAAESARDAFRKAHTAEADAAFASFYRGRFDSIDQPFTVREDTFAGIPVTDPNVLVSLIVEWSLTPNRSVRGAAPWDAIIYKLDPGFDNLPEPKDKAVQEAAGTSKPY